jgi:[acyl-carrier-protein] S-malonyltransferase
MINVAFIFPGQGAQYVGMGDSLCDEYSIVRKTFKEASDVCGYNILNFCRESNYGELINSEKSLSALLTISIAIYRVFEKNVNIEPGYLTGYSFGELTALVCAESISFEDALKISLYKGKVIREVIDKTNSGMTAIDGIRDFEIKKICKKLSKQNNYINIGVFNSETNVVVSGDIDLIEKLEKILKIKKIQYNRLEIIAPFHSNYFNEVILKLEQEIKKYKIKKPCIPTVSSLTANPLKNKNEIIYSLSKHFIKPVQWSKTIDFLINKKTEKIIEIGPKKILSSGIKKKNKNIEIYSFSSSQDMNNIKNIFFNEK